MGSQYNSSDLRTLVAAEAISKYLRMKVDSNAKWALAGVGEATDGIAQDNYASAEDAVGKLFNSGETVMVVASGACSVGDSLYGAASGKVSTTVSGPPQFKALEAATADGDIIEALPLSSATAGFQASALTVTAKTADYTVTTGDTGKAFTNTGAAGTIVFSMPAATVGLRYTFGVGAAQALRIDPNGSETVSLPSTGVPGAAGKYLGCSTVGCTVNLVCLVAGNWNVVGHTGTWAAEP